MAKKEQPEQQPDGFEAGSRRYRPHPYDGWFIDRDTDKPPVREAGGEDDFAAGDPERGNKA